MKPNHDPRTEDSIATLLSPSLQSNKTSEMYRIPRLTMFEHLVFQNDRPYMAKSRQCALTTADLADTSFGPYFRDRGVETFAGSTVLRGCDPVRICALTILAHPVSYRILSCH